MFKETIVVQQHTPMIHFQHEQEGASLRATELKPKLDRFLISKLDHVDASWKVGGGVEGQLALDYKVSISVPEVTTSSIVSKDIPTFFANLGEVKEKFFTQTEKDIQIIFRSFNKELLVFIRDHIQEFFTLNNFGTRQSKGFGNFLPKDCSFTDRFYSFSVKSSEIRVLFSTIDLFYKTLRSGLNGAKLPSEERGFIKGFYMKPMIWQYAYENNIVWEKRKIKETYFKKKQREQQNDSKNKPNDSLEPTPLHKTKEQGRVVRDWLGLSSDQKWKDYPRRGSSINVKKEHIQFGKEENEITRMKSPILFKPVKEGKGYRVYFTGIRDDVVEKQFRKAKFAIHADKGQGLTLNTWSKFDLDKFLEFSFEEDRIESSFHPRNKAEGNGGKIYQELIRIYKEIRASKKANNE